MTNDLRLTFVQWAYAGCLAVALFLGVMLATSGTPMGALGVAAVILALCFPLLLKWHHPLLICTWNSSFILYALPGQPQLWVVLSLSAIGFLVLERAVRKDTRFLHVPAVSGALVFLGLVVLLTAAGTGGMGSRVMGSQVYGGSRYFSTLAAIVGYFGLVSQPIRPDRAGLMASLFFLAGITAVASDLIYLAGPRFYDLYLFFPAELAFLRASTESTLPRATGLAWGSIALFYFVLVRYGIRGVLNLRRPWRLLLFITAIVSCFFGGYRSSVLVMGLVFAFQFFFEGLHRTRILPILLAAGLVAGPIFISNLERMPLPVQRSFSFLPVTVHAMARADAISTMDWRLAMWKIMLPEVPRYLWMGKGYGFSGAEFHLANEAILSGVYREYEAALITGEYHNGALTLLIPFGVWGLIGFLWLTTASLAVLWRNWRYGDPELERVNTFLIAYYAARFAVYFTVYGQFEKELAVFTGAVGLSISLNRGVRGPETDEAQPPQALAPAGRPAFGVGRAATLPA